MPQKVSLNNIALVGNPNTGKSSLFNILTGLNQKVGNYTGVTVDKKRGELSHKGKIFEITDLPGVYSVYPKSLDEKVVLDLLLDTKNNESPEGIISVVDASNLRRSLLLFTQICDLGYPVLVALTMNDLAQEQGHYIDEKKLSSALGCTVVKINSRTKQGIEDLKNKIAEGDFKKISLGIPIHNTENQITQKINQDLNLNHPYKSLILAHQYQNNTSISYHEKNKIENIVAEEKFKSIPAQARENILRYESISNIYDKSVIDLKKSKSQRYTDVMDKILIHNIWGYFLLLAMILIVIQLVFTVSEFPMAWIETIGGMTIDYVDKTLKNFGFLKILANGLLAGIFGVLVFIPQIALLFMFIGLLEESGYMSRAVFITDKLMRKVGMNGRSVIPLFSGIACAVPAIMATRTIDNPKDRLITLLVTPLISCSARIPVYTILIGLFVPDIYYWEIISLKALVFMLMYVIGFLIAIICSYFLKKIITIKHSSFFVMELPSLKMPNWFNVFISIIEKIKSFVFEAGKTIVAISILLTLLSYYGPSEKMKDAGFLNPETTKFLNEDEKANIIAAQKLEASYAGQFGKMIEPVISPLGYDWKIGIAILTSFAAREVFVPTISTIYNLGTEEENDGVIIQKMKNLKDPKTGKPLYGPALCISLLLFYALSMQCVSTLATTKRETKSWKWPIIQFVGLTAIAYFASLLAFQILS